MKRITCMLWLLLGMSAAAIPLHAQEKIKAPVEKVTLFIDGAQITRTEQLDLKAGNTTLVFTELSPYLDQKSLQVGARGPFTVVSVNRRVNHTDSLERSERAKALEKEFEEVKRGHKALQAQRKTAEEELAMLKVNCSTGNRTAAVSLTEIREINAYYAAGLERIRQRMLELDEKERDAVIRERQLAAQLAEAGGKPSDPMSEIEVCVEAPAACKASFTLTYYVRNAGWFPSYDVRSDGLSAPIAISYKANIFQNTREQWKNVALTLSSSNPNTGNIAPQLKTYWLDYGLAAPRYDLSPGNNTVSGTVFDAERNPLPGAKVLIPGTTIETITDTQGRYSVTIPNGAEQLQFSYVGYLAQTCPITGGLLNIVMQEESQTMQEQVVMTCDLISEFDAVTETLSQPSALAKQQAAPSESRVMEVTSNQGRLGYEFEIRQPYTIPSDGKAVAAEIGRFDLPARYTYRATPKIDKDAFLTAEATDWEKLNLLEGEANVYFENTFVGKSILNPAQAADTLYFSLGRDRSIRIERTKLTDHTVRRSIGSNQTQTMAWKFTVRNTRTEPVALTLCDQLPVSRNNTITVTEEELSGGRLDKESGLVFWQLELGPGEQRELHLRYAVKYPKERTLTIE